ncbi:MAG: anaerobic ribonucleoside-triphosphate reductase activating protein [Planctomycetota bacterium]|nr:anaerobic ribonucleoside-triphosphate reductase activating protein [Planctomycetota bacterium]MDW8372229.1 anaerobic ribonucleoside-triphosphate reductase activating protein [Planctomycetota bacterium]
MIPIAAVQPLTLSDFPGRPAAIVFLAGCNWRCVYCHNRRLWEAAEPALAEDAVLADLERRRGLITGAVISGGEPTLCAELPAFLERLRALGLAVKLDTNGSQPARLQAVLEAGLVDYVALDLKAEESRHDALTGSRAEFPLVRRALALLRAQRVPYELRTTVCGELHDEAGLRALLAELLPGERWWLQACRPPPGTRLSPPDPRLLARIAAEARARGVRAEIR